MAKVNGSFATWAIRILIMVIIGGVSSILTIQENKITANEEKSLERDAKLDDKVQQLREDTNGHLMDIKDDISEQKVAQTKQEVHVGEMKEDIKDIKELLTYLKNNGR